MKSIFENPLTLAFLGTRLVLCAPVCVLMSTGMFCRYCRVGVCMRVYRPKVNIRGLPPSLYLAFRDKFSMNLKPINSPKLTDRWVLGICSPPSSSEGVILLLPCFAFLHVNTWHFPWVLGIWARGLMFAHYWLKHLPRFQSCPWPHWLWQANAHIPAKRVFHKFPSCEPHSPCDCSDV